MQWLGHFSMCNMSRHSMLQLKLQNSPVVIHKHYTNFSIFFQGFNVWANIIDEAHRCMGVLSTEKMPITKLVGENAETQIVICKGLCAARKWLQLLGKSRMWITWMWKPFIWYMLSIIAKHIICIAEAKRQQKSDLIFHDMAYYLAWSSLVSNTLETCLA